MAETNLTPKLRFPEFKGKWEKEKLGKKTIKIGSGKTPKGGEKIYKTTGIPFIRSQNVLKDELALDNVHIPIEIHYECESRFKR